MADYKTQVGQRIRELRQDRKVSQAEMAKRAGITQATVSFIENGERATDLDTVVAIAKALGVGPEVVLGVTDHDVSECYRRVGDELKKKAPPTPRGSYDWLRSLTDSEIDALDEGISELLAKRDRKA